MEYNLDTFKIWVLRQDNWFDILRKGKGDACIVKEFERRCEVLGLESKAVARGWGVPLHSNVFSEFEYIVRSACEDVTVRPIIRF